MIPQLKSACCCCTLKVGSVIIALLDAVGHLVGILVHEDQVGDEFTDETMVFSALWPNVHRYFLIVHIMLLFTCVLLVAGVSMNQEVLIVLWHFAFISFSLIDYVGEGIVLVLMAAAPRPPIHAILQKLAWQTLQLCVSIYFVLVVYSFYRDLRRQPRTPIFL